MLVLVDCMHVTSCTGNSTRHAVSCMRTHLGVCPLHSQPEGVYLLGAHLLHVGHQVDILLPIPFCPAQSPFLLYIHVRTHVLHLLLTPEQLKLPFQGMQR